MLLAFSLVTASFFLFLFIIWKSDTVLNITLKYISFVMVVWALYVAAILHGIHL